MTKKTKRKSYSADTKQKAIELIKQGVKTHDIASQLNMSPASVYNMKSRMKITSTKKSTTSKTSKASISATNKVTATAPVAVRTAQSKLTATQEIEQKIASRREEIEILQKTLEILNK